MSTNQNFEVHVIQVKADVVHVCLVASGNFPGQVAIVMLQFCTVNKLESYQVLLFLLLLIYIGQSVYNTFLMVHSLIFQIRITSQMQAI